MLKTNFLHSDVEPDGNPLVAGFQDDIDSDEDLTQPLPGIAIVDAETENDPDDEVTPPVDTTTASESPNPVRKLSTASSTGKKSIQDELVVFCSFPCLLAKFLSFRYSSHNMLCFRGSLDGEVSTITGDALDAWFSSDSKLRRSPEGGEDNGSRASGGSRGSRDGDVTLPTQTTSNISEKKKKQKKEKDQEKVRLLSKIHYLH